MFSGFLPFTYSYYGVKCLGFLSQRKWGYLYNYFYLISIVLSAIATVDVVIGIIDLSFALMCIPNMFTILYLSKRVKERINIFTKASLNESKTVDHFAHDTGAHSGLVL